MSSLDCLCDDPINSVANDRCSKIDYGNQIVKIFFQKMTGADFNGTTDNNITVEADWQIRRVADNDDRIVVIGNLSNAVLPPAEPTVEEGNEVPYGGVEIIDTPRSITAELKYINAADMALLDKVNCWPQVRMWFLTNKNWLYAQELTTGQGVPNVSVIPIGYSLEGIGVSNKAGLRVQWNNICMPKPVAQLPFLALFDGSNLSGSTV